MKPLVYYDFKETNDGEVSISKNRLEEILNEVYQAGYTDGSNNKSYITTTPWSTTLNGAWCGSTQPQPREITSTNPMQRPDYTITCSNQKTDGSGLYQILIYSNDDPMAILAMEMERTGNYGDCDEYSAEKCPVCGAYEPEYYYLDKDEECIGCSECVYRTEVLF